MSSEFETGAKMESPLLAISWRQGFHCNVGDIFNIKEMPRLLAKVDQKGSAHSFPLTIGAAFIGTIVIAVGHLYPSPLKLEGHVQSLPQEAVTSHFAQISYAGFPMRRSSYQHRPMI